MHGCVSICPINICTATGGMRGWQASMGALKCTRATLSMPSGSQRVRTSTANAYRHNRWKCTTDCDTITSAAYKLDLNWATSHPPVLYYVVFNQSSHRISARDRWWLEQHNTSEPCATPLAPVRNESSPICAARFSNFHGPAQACLFFPLRGRPATPEGIFP